MKRPPLLSVVGLSVGYYGRNVIEELSFDLATHQIRVLVGPNGCGKTTVLNALCGLLRPLDGVVRYRGQAVNTDDPSWYARNGLILVPQHRKVFPRLSVEQNLRMASLSIDDRQMKSRLTDVVKLFPDLSEVLGRPSGELSGGVQQMVALGRAIVARPQVMLLDEPTVGLAPAVADRFGRFLEAEAEVRGTGVLIVEHNICWATGLGAEILRLPARNLAVEQLLL